MVYYNPDHYGWSITTPYVEEEEEEDSLPIKQKNKKNKVVSPEETIPEQEKSTRKKSVITNIFERTRQREES